MNSISNLVKGYVRESFERLTYDLKQTLTSVRRFESPEGSNGKQHGSRVLPELKRELDEQFRQVAATWEQSTWRELSELVTWQLMELVESLPQSIGKTIEPVATIELPSPPRITDLAKSARVDDESDPTTNLRGGIGNGCTSLDRAHRSQCGGRAGVLKRQALMGFLKRRGFEKESKQTGELAFRAPNGQRISIPPCHGSDIRTGTGNKILKRVGEILGEKLMVLRGEIVSVTG